METLTKKRFFASEGGVEAHEGLGAAARQGKAEAPCLATKCGGDSDEEAFFASEGGVEAHEELGAAARQGKAVL